MKVTVPLTLDVDPDAWTRDYGVTGAAAIREDVRWYVLHAVQGLPAAAEGGIRSAGLAAGSISRQSPMMPRN